MSTSADVFTLIGAGIISGVVALGFFILKASFTRAVGQFDQAFGKIEKSIEKIYEKMDYIQKHVSEKYATKDDLERVEKQNSENHKRMFEKIDMANEKYAELRGEIKGSKNG